MEKEAQEGQGRWRLGQWHKEQGPLLVVSEYGVHVSDAYNNGDGHPRLDQNAHGGAYMDGDAIADLRKHLDGLWQCDECHHWCRGEGACPWCGAEKVTCQPSE